MLGDPGCRAEARQMVRSACLETQARVPIGLGGRPVFEGAPCCRLLREANGTILSNKKDTPGFGSD